MLMPCFKCLFLELAFCSLFLPLCKGTKIVWTSKRKCLLLFPFLRVYIYNVRAYIYNKLFEIPLSPSLSSFFFVFLTFPPCSYFANLRPIVQLLANSQIMEPFTPLSALVQAFALLFWLCILLLSFVPSSLVGCSDRSPRLSQSRFLVLSWAHFLDKFSQNLTLKC